MIISTIFSSVHLQERCTRGLGWMCPNKSLIQEGTDIGSHLDVEQDLNYVWVF
jgi:hypothetical protein